MTNKEVIKENALSRLKKAMEHKRNIKESIEKEYAACGKVANVVFL